MEYRRWTLLFAALASCVTEVPGEEPAPLDEIELAADNGIFLDNGLKLTNGADAGNGIKLTNGFNLANGLDLANGIKLTNGSNLIEPPPGSDLEAWIDVDPTMRLRVIRYEVECALPAGAAVDATYRGQSFTFVGQTGLGPSWLAGLMVPVEQERVSACLLARVNARGDRLRITLVGPYAGLDTLSAAELASYPNREATFVGNLFADAPRAYVYNLACGSRACQIDLATGFCHCGIVRTSSVWCNNDDGGTFHASCSTALGTSVYQNPITTYVAQAPPGGACAGDVDCMTYNCEAGICGGLGAECGWKSMCVPPVGCGLDHRCGGEDAPCTQNDHCLSKRCSRGTCR